MKENQNTLKNGRIEAFDFIRAICALGIIAFHFSCHLPEGAAIMPFYRFSNGDFGNLTVNLFFIISGGVIFYNNSEIKSVRKFYRKRIKSIYPMFYIAFAVFFAVDAVRKKSLFFGGNPLKLIFSVIGIDGYLKELSFQNYYQVGEWFLGVIIVIYALYPLLLKCFNKSSVLTALGVTALYATVFINGLYPMPKSLNLFSCLISFTAGMCLVKYKDIWYKKPVIAVLSVIISAVLLSVNIPFADEDLIIHILAAAMFFVLCFAGSFVMKVKPLNAVFGRLSGISYAVFLLQHKIVIIIGKIYAPQKPLEIILMLILAAVVTVALSYLLTVFTDKILKAAAHLLRHRGNKETT